MPDIDNEKVQFLLAAARTKHWKQSISWWTNDVLRMQFDTVPPVKISISTDIPGWDDMPPGDKLAAAESTLTAALADYPGFDPTIPGFTTA